MIHGIPAASQNAIKTEPVTTQPTANQTPNGWLTTYDVASVDSHVDFRKLRAADAVTELGMIVSSAIGGTGAGPTCALVAPTSVGFSFGFGICLGVTGIGTLISSCIGAKMAYREKGCLDACGAYLKDDSAAFKAGLKDACCYNE